MRRSVSVRHCHFWPRREPPADSIATSPRLFDHVRGCQIETHEAARVAFDGQTPTAARGPVHAPPGSFAALTLGAVGIVYGDIGTSPLYALNQIFFGHDGG